MVARSRRAPAAKLLEQHVAVAPVPAAEPLALEVVRDEERDVERLLKVEARVAEALVAQRQLRVGEAHAPAGALGHAEAVVRELARELEAHAAERGAARGVRADARRQLADDRPEVARLEARGRGEGAVGARTRTSVRSREGAGEGRRACRAWGRRSTSPGARTVGRRRCAPGGTSRPGPRVRQARVHMQLECIPWSRRTG